MFQVLTQMLHFYSNYITLFVKQFQNECETAEYYDCSFKISSGITGGYTFLHIFSEDVHTSFYRMLVNEVFVIQTLCLREEKFFLVQIM